MTVHERRILKRLVRIMALLGPVAVIPSVYAAVVAGFWPITAVDLVAYAAVLWVAYHPRATARLQAAVLIGGSGVVGAVVLLMTGMAGAGYIWLMAMVILAAAFGSVRTIWLTVCVMLATLGVYAVMAYRGTLDGGQSPLVIAVVASNLFLVSVGITYVINRVISRLRRLAVHQTNLLMRLRRELQENRSIQASLDQSLRAERRLLHELDHRVRNNLQVSLSLLNMADRSSGAVEQRSAFTDLRLRVEAMAAVSHLQEPSAGRVDLVQLLLQIAAGVRRAYAEPPVEWVVRAPDSAVPMNIDRATGVAIACTEILTNAMKHAFVSEPVPRIDVSIGAGEDSIAIEVLDNGCGMELDEESGKPVRRPRGHGLMLVDALVRQARSAVVCQSTPGGGVRYRITVPHDPEEDQPGVDSVYVP